MWVIYFFCPFPLSSSLHPAFPCLPLWWRTMQGKWNQTEEKNGTLIFFFFFFCLHSTPDGFFRSLLFHASSSLFFPPPCLELSVITSHNSLPICCTVLLWGLRRSWLFIKENKVCENRESEFICFVCFSESCSGWPVPDDKEPRRFSQHPWCTGDWVQKWFVLVKCVTCWFLCQSPLYIKLSF